jgi:hypothetical protein
MNASPTLAAVRLASLRRDGDVLMSALPVTLVSLERQVRFDSGFGRLASGPLSALYAPAGFRFSLAPGEDVRGVFALTLAGEGETRRELLPARVPIADEVFEALLACERDVPWVRVVHEGDALAPVLAWLREDAVARHMRCTGRLVSRQALRWVGEVTASEDALIAAPELRSRNVPLPAALADRALVRRFSRVTGYAPRRYAREWHRRVALA